MSSLYILLTVVASSSQASIPTYSIVAIEYRPAPLEQVGKVKAGLLCLPKGKLRWRDVARPDQAVLMTRVEQALIETGLPVAAQPDPLYGDPLPVTRYRIRVSVYDVSLKICTAGDVMFIGKVGRAPKTEGSIAVLWETFDRAARMRIRQERFVIPVDDQGGDARSTSRVLNDAVVKSAVLYATAQKASD